MSAYDGSSFPGYHGRSGYDSDRCVCVRRTTSPLATGRGASASLVTVGRNPARCHDPASADATRSRTRVEPGPNTTVGARRVCVSPVNPFLRPMLRSVHGRKGVNYGPSGRIGQGPRVPYWRLVLARWKPGGLSVRAFCLAEGVSVPSFYVCVRRTTSPLAIGRGALANLVTVGWNPTRCHDPASADATRSSTRVEPGPNSAVGACRVSSAGGSRCQLGEPSAMGPSGVAGGSATWGGDQRSGRRSARFSLGRVGNRDSTSRK
ncbi:hypothetical protein SAMN05444166_6949 [Singulisphaera sp. GP187]|nr:hypothetical protein SAMN05444166_6949 [Singulisphaera sp. GP187]